MTGIPPAGQVRPASVLRVAEAVRAQRFELVSRRTRSGFRDACSDFGINRTIAQAFEDEGFAPASDDVAPVPGDAASWDRQGQRRGTFDQYAASVDWTDGAHVRRVLRVFEEIYSWAGEPVQTRLAGYLRRDGCEVDDHGRIRRTIAAGASLELLLAQLQLTDPAAVQEHLDRLTRLGDTDPPAAVSAAKALLEATVKAVLVELGEPVVELADLPALVKRANRALGLDRRDIAPTAAGADIVNRLLANLADIPVGLGRLRNEYGPDHGRTRPAVGLHPRHAQLAVDAAATYCRFLLATLADRRASAPPTPAP